MINWLISNRDIVKKKDFYQNVSKLNLKYLEDE